ncbi:hypothetical protein C8Q75DRAFT_761773 [Abortiporus biennis]|nr:hypothetical protein C8Q75DRAFT_761773 [Abortiporus biennis]
MNDLSSQWRSIRPWRPTLSLSVREVTSVSATFILSSPLASADSASSDPFLVSLGLSHIDDDEDDEGDEEESEPESNDVKVVDGANRHPQIISDVLSKGLSVKVNGTPWQRVLMKIDDEADEAVIILFGLMPGRQYDIELGIVPGENSIRRQITTASRSRSATESSQETTLTNTPPHESLSLTSSPPPGLANIQLSDGSINQNSTLTPPQPPFSLEDRRLQLTHTLNLLNSEHATLTATLKSARRESQKADAALRSEIDTLKRTSEKNAALEHRARQKVLALQEAVRRTVAATEEIRMLIEDVEGSLPELERRRVEVESEHRNVKKEAESVRAKRNEVELKEKRRIEGLQSEMASLGNRLERLNVRKEKLDGEGGVLSELEERLRKLEEERERVENDPFGYGYGFDDDDNSAEVGRGSAGSRTEDSSSMDRPQHNHQHHNRNHSPNHYPHNQQHPNNHHNHHHHPRKRHSHPTHQRGPMATQRPTHNSRLSLPAGPGVIHLNVNPNRSNSDYHHHGPRNQSSNTSSNIPQPSTVTSNLSSRAPAFEPSNRRRGHSQSSLVGPVKSDLNPASNVFSPRPGIAIAAAAVANGNVKRPTAHAPGSS